MNLTCDVADAAAALLQIVYPLEPPLRIHPGGAVRVGNTRVSLDTVVAAFNHGCPPEEIVERFPTLDLRDVYTTIAAYLNYRQAVDEYLALREREAEDLRRAMEVRNQ